MKVAIIGSGYVGLIAAACFADSGNTVFCLDCDHSKIEKLINGIIPIYEPGLAEIVQKNLKAKRLIFSTDLPTYISEADVIFIAVGTPTDQDGQADLSSVFSVAEMIGKSLKKYAVVVNKSTVPVGTYKKVKDLIQKQTSFEFDIVSNPEFLKEGAALDDFLRPERVVIGTDSEKAAKIMKILYAPFIRTGAAILIMDNCSAEMSKYASNAMLAARISFINEIANICDVIGADVSKVRHAMGLDSRIGQRFLFPGVGYGGSCFPKDVQALAATAKQYGYNPVMIDAVEHVNNNQKRKLFDMIMQRFAGNIKNKKIAVWGLAFKPKTDDMREAPSITLITLLLEAGAIVSAYDPVAMETAKVVFGDSIEYCDDQYEVLNDADMLCLVTEWNEFRNPDFSKIKELMKTSIIFDGRNQYEPEFLKEIKIEYHCIGRAL